MKRFYQPNAPGYGAATIANVANPTSAYTALPTDLAVLVDLSGYSGAGPTITWCGTPREDFPVCIRSVAGSGASHNWTIAAPTGLTIEDPENPGTFGASVTVAAAFEGGVWNYDRQHQRLFLEAILVAAATPSPAITSTTTKTTNIGLTTGVTTVVTSPSITIAAGQKVVVHFSCQAGNTGEVVTSGETLFTFAMQNDGTTTLDTFSADVLNGANNGTAVVSWTGEFTGLTGAHTFDVTGTVNSTTDLPSVAVARLTTILLPG